MNPDKGFKTYFRNREIARTAEVRWLRQQLADIKRRIERILTEDYYTNKKIK